MQVRKITLKHVKGTEFKDDKGRQWKFYKVPGQSKAAADKRNSCTTGQRKQRSRHMTINDQIGIRLPN